MAWRLMFVTERVLLCQVMTPLQACSAFVGLYPWFPGVSSRPLLAICFFLSKHLSLRSSWVPPYFD